FTVVARWLTGEAPNQILYLPDPSIPLKGSLLLDSGDFEHSTLRRIRISLGSCLLKLAWT
ncbi:MULTISPECIES: hypothetical protein, partial [unclassified Neptuniibacter]|uniref:hypothetical protein n=1 Tax=unclassified Neptuniibacter TaxID=2630693 RepID=UPI0025FC5446